MRPIWSTQCCLSGESVAFSVHQSLTFCTLSEALINTGTVYKTWTVPLCHWGSKWWMMIRCLWNDTMHLDILSKSTTLIVWNGRIRAQWLFHYEQNQVPVCSTHFEIYLRLFASPRRKSSNFVPPNPKKKILTLPCSPHPQSTRQGTSLTQIKMSSSASVSTRENRGAQEQQCEQWEGWRCQQPQGEEERVCVCFNATSSLWRIPVKCLIHNHTKATFQLQPRAPQYPSGHMCAQGQGKFVCTARFRHKATQSALQGHANYIQMK